MEDERELNLREYFATLLLKAKMGEDIKNEALTLIGDITPRYLNIADESYKQETSTLYLSHHLQMKKNSILFLVLS